MISTSVSVPTSNSQYRQCRQTKLKSAQTIKSYKSRDYKPKKRGSEGHPRKRCRECGEPVPRDIHTNAYRDGRCIQCYREWHESHMPDAAEIAEACASIRTGWPEGEEYRRMVYTGETEPFIVPTVHIEPGILAPDVEMF